MNVISYVEIDNAICYNYSGLKAGYTWIYPRFRSWGNRMYKKNHQLAVL